jgi:OOP family OmpA-OmpF porin
MLAPTVEQALSQSIYNDPKHLADVLYPVMGPAIRKSINETLTEALGTFNQLLEQSLSLRALHWRFDAWRTGRSYSEIALMHTLVYQVEQVFLIHRHTSLLLGHVVADNAISNDPDMVSSMLTAIQDFIADSFHVQQEEHLRTLSLGDLTVLVEHGPYAVIALVVRGNSPSDLRALVVEVLETIHRQYAQALKTYNGDNAAFSPVAHELSKCLKVQRQTRTQQKPWLAYGAFISLGLGLAYAGYQHYSFKQWQQAVIQATKDLPGIALLETEVVDDQFVLKGLQDPLVTSPLEQLPANLLAAHAVQWQAKPYLSMDEALVLQRAQHLLKPPQTVKLALKQGVLSLQGQAEQTWLSDAQQRYTDITGINALDTTQLVVNDLAALTIQRLSQAIAKSSYNFALASADIEAQQADIVHLSQTMLALLTAAHKQQKFVQIKLIGNTDLTGSDAFNTSLALQRAQNMRNILVTAGVPAFCMVAYGAGQQGLPSTTKKNERSVTYQVDLY